MEQWIEGFVYRGRPPSGPGSDLEPAWHAEIGEQSDHPAGDGRKTREPIQTLNMAQAEAAGWGLPEALQAINAEMIKYANELEAKVAELERDLEKSRQTIATLEYALANIQPAA